MEGLCLVISGERHYSASAHLGELAGVTGFRGGSRQFVCLYLVDFIRWRVFSDAQTRSSSTNEFTTIRRTINRGFGYDQESVADSGFAGSEAAGTDYGYAMRRFILDDETVVEESPALSPVFDVDKDPFEVHESLVSTPVADVVPNDQWWRPPQPDNNVTRKPVPVPAPMPTRVPAPDPVPTRPSAPPLSTHPRDRTTTILRKTIVSPAALWQKQIKYTEENKHVKIMRNLDKAEVDELRSLSLDMCKHRA